MFLPCRAENPAGHGSKEVKGKTHTYYQVLIDARDCPHIVSKMMAGPGVLLQGKGLNPNGDKGRERGQTDQINTGPQDLRTGS